MPTRESPYHEQHDKRRHKSACHDDGEAGRLRLVVQKVVECFTSIRLRLPAADELHNQTSRSLNLFSMCWHAKLDEQLDAGAARSCANLRMKEAACSNCRQAS